MRLTLFDIENWKEIIATLSRNKTRTFLTAFGIFWGTAMLAMLWGGAQGARDLLFHQFDGLSTNLGGIMASRTTLPYKGYNKGMRWSLTLSDADAIKRLIPGIEALTPGISRSATVAYGSKSSSSSALGVESSFAAIQVPEIIEGRFINESDDTHSRKVCVMGKRVASELFGTASPLGKFVSINGIFYNVVGVIDQTNEVSIGSGQLSESVVIPITTMRLAYNLGEKVDDIIFTVKSGQRPRDLRPHVERILRAAHPIHPDDKYAIRFIDISEQFEMVGNVFTGVDLLALFVGFSSLLAGIIGVGNIMWIIVKERTQEIGIRRAIGAKPRDIIVQILSESVVLTIVAGVAGICFAVAVLAIVAHVAGDPDWTPAFQLSFGHSIAILVTFGVLGTAAGTIPALKAMRIKPIEALNDK